MNVINLGAFLVAVLHPQQLALAHIEVQPAQCLAESVPLMLSLTCSTRKKIGVKA
jgi:hypothetical protein